MFRNLSNWIRNLFNQRKREKALEAECELLNREHYDRLREIEADHDRRIFELFQNCCTNALANNADSRETWNAIRTHIDAAEAESDRIQEETVAANDVEHNRYMEALRSLYKRYGFNLSSK